MPLYIELAALQCPACSKFFTKTRGRDSHLSQARSCKWYCRGKLREISFRDDLHPQVVFSDTQTVTQLPDESSEQGQGDLGYAWEDPNWPDPSDEEGGYRDDNEEADEEVNLDEFILLPQPGPGPQTQENRNHRPQATQPWVLDDEDDTRVVVEHPTAGEVLSRVRDKDGDIAMGEASSSRSATEQFKPFNAELDWKFAEWAIKESIGHNALDRLLAIPGV